MLNLRNVTVRLAQPAELAKLWRAGDIDGAYVWEPHLSLLKVEFPAARTLIAGGLYSYDLCSYGLYSHCHIFIALKVEFPTARTLISGGGV